MNDCESCADRDGVIEWRDSLWCPDCFEAEAENRTRNHDWISRVLGVYDDGEFSPPLDAAGVDLDARVRTLGDRTVLKQREADVRALKERGLTHSQIAARLDIEKGTVDTYSRRINDRIERAEATVEMLDG